MASGKVVQTAPPGHKETPSVTLWRCSICVLITRIYIICSIWEAVILTVHEAYRLSELEEVLGELHSVEIAKIGLVATIGKISVWLPEELAEQLKGLVGRRMAILRLEGYHLRCLEVDKHV